MLISFWFTCLLVARAMSIVLMNSCNPFALLDLAFMRTHRATKALMPSSATSSLPSDWFLSAAASRLKRESKLGASVLTSESTVSSENFSNPSKLSGPWTKQDSRLALVLPVQCRWVYSLLIVSSSGVDFPALADGLCPIVWRFQAEADA